MLLIETDMHFVWRLRRGTSLCSKSALVWGHAHIAAELWPTMPRRNTLEAELTGEGTEFLCDFMKTTEIC